MPSSYELSFWYGDQYEVKLGNSENLPYKLAYLEKVLESLADYQTGTIDLSFSEGSEARFTRSSENDTENVNYFLKSEKVY